MAEENLGEDVLDFGNSCTATTTSPTVVNRDLDVSAEFICQAVDEFKRLMRYDCPDVIVMTEMEYEQFKTKVRELPPVDSLDNATWISGPVSLMGIKIERVPDIVDVLLRVLDLRMCGVKTAYCADLTKYLRQLKPVEPVTTEPEGVS